jgi:hypothetical protein
MSYEEAFELYETTQLTLAEIAQEACVNYSWLHTKIKAKYPDEYRKARKIKNYAASKEGDKNPMKGKYAEAHHNYIGDVSDGKGYHMRIKPDWYTGRIGCKHVFVHHIVMCEALGITEIPQGFHVHHIDENKTNNNLNNLALLEAGAHARLHGLERVTTIPKGSRGKTRSGELELSQKASS